MSGHEYRVVWKREGLRRRTTIRQTLAGAHSKVTGLRGDYSFYTDHGSQMEGADWYDEMGVPPLEFVRIEYRPVGDWSDR